MNLSKILLIALLGSSFQVVAQQNLITCSAERNSDNSVAIFADSQIYGEYTVKITFTTLAGYTCSQSLIRNSAIVTVDGGKRMIMKLTQEKNASQYSYQYSYTYLPGRSLRKYPDTSVRYLMPAVAGKQLRVSTVNSLEELIQQKNTSGFSGAGFYYKAGDTICAARAGIVYDCNEAVQEGEKASQTFKRERNSISVQHKDGTIGHYAVLAPIRLLVKPGDFVLPGQPLAYFSKESERLMVLFSSYFLDEKKFLAEKRESSVQPSFFTYMPLHFYNSETPNGSLESNRNYVVQYNKDIVEAELSKKDKKRLGL